MRNLKNIRRSPVSFDNGLPLTATTWDTATESLICAFGPSAYNTLLELKRVANGNKVSKDRLAAVKDYGLEQIAAWDALCPLPDLDCDRIIDLHYFPDNLTACLVLAGGDIVVVREEPSSTEDKIEIVGSVDAGIAAARWSPDEDLLAISTSASTLLFMTRDFEGIVDVALVPEDLQASKHVSVGWGKSETQFKGKRAKALRDPTMPEKVDEGSLSSYDDGRVTISWRGDGAYVALNTIESGARRIVRVYSREGVLDSVSEPVDGLEAALSWRPAGNLLAGVQRLDERIDVVFFERNGLRHGQFTSRLTSKEMGTWGQSIDLEWNVDSTVLAMCYQDRVQLWTMGNYHYYLKQELVLSGGDVLSVPVSIKWHPEKALLFTISTSDELQTLEYISISAGGSTSSPYDFGTLAVLDGKSLNLTPLRLANVPPPMALHQVNLKEVAIDIAVNHFDLEIPPNDPEKDERCRSIERGARLLTVMPTVFSLTLQMPRGNLETIYPRALVLAGIRRSIAISDYKTAFFACRNQRVDMNILHDHAPQQFLSSVGLFVDQVKKVPHIDLFLSQLREENVTETMYKETLRVNKLENPQPSTNGILQSQGQIDPTSSTISKVNRICNAFLDILQDRISTNLQNIITAHVCKSPPDLDAGLLVVARFREENIEMAEKAVEHICFLADVNHLYDNALGLYDLELALLVAQQSQKDPREYLPFLQNLQEMPHERKQFSIDNYLGRYAKALTHLHTLQALDELKVFTQKHQLHREALNLYRYQEDNLRELMRLYADFLNSQSKFKEAGIAYEYLSDYTSASEAYRAAHLWREALTCANLAPLPQPSIISLAHRLADALFESKEYFSAATIHLDYLADIETAARIFCKGYYFAEAVRFLGLHQRQDLLSSVLDAGLVEGLASMTELLADCKAQLGAQVPRLRELRAKKAEDPLSFYDPSTTDPSADIPDNISLAPTDTSTSGGNTLFTRYTNRSGTHSTLNTTTTRQTSKNRRREERKRARGKKGSVYEEEYLINSIGRLIDRVNSVRDEVSRLVEGLVRRAMRERAVAVEAAMGDVIKICKGCIDEVFGPGEKEAMVGSGQVVGGIGAEGNGEVRPAGGDGVVWDSLEERGRRERPVVKDFERLSLLGT
ncbi:MAG: hypothetical protein M1827_002878 [Pycnora praestabilis]|nr:MAG: hypothetical protein M1827_002878 [Pycnora praestabilis]